MLIYIGQYSMKALNDFHIFFSLKQTLVKSRYELTVQVRTPCMPISNTSWGIIKKTKINLIIWVEENIELMVYKETRYAFLLNILGQYVEVNMWGSFEYTQYIKYIFWLFTIVFQ